MRKTKANAWRTALSILSLATVYFIASKFVLSLPVLPPKASAISPATGIALASLLLWGNRLWPGVFLGAFLVSITTQGVIAVALAIAFGNTLQAVLGAWLIDHFANGPKVFERAKNTLKFALLAAFISTTVSATFGVSSLVLAAYAQPDPYTTIWLTWWLADVLGSLLIAPLLVIWLTEPYPQVTPRRILEAAGLLLTLLSLGYIVFWTENYDGLEYLALLPLLWATFRFGKRGAVTAAFFTAAIALVGTYDGIGPFATDDPNESLIHLQGFMGTIAMSALVLASIVSERMRAEERIEIRDAVSRILADSPDLKKAGSKILQALRERARWATGCIWNLDRTANAMVCADFWHLPGLSVPQLEASSRQRSFARGVGLPGQVWSSGNALWIPDLTKDRNFTRASIAAEEGRRAALGFPISVGGEILGVIECFSREARERDDDFLQSMGDIGAQVGRFIERKRAEEALFESEKELADFFDTSPLSLHWVGQDGTILRANDAELTILGYSEQEYIGRNIADFHVDKRSLTRFYIVLHEGRSCTSILPSCSAKMARSGMS